MSDRKIKLTHPKGWQSGVAGLKSDYLQQTQGGEGIWGTNSFSINSPIDQCDMWIVHGNLDTKETVYCNGPSVFVLSEEADQWVWNQEFVEQFDIVIGSQKDIKHPAYYRGQYLCPWQVHKSYDELKLATVPQKTRVLSAVISDSTYNEGHKKRFAFTNKLKGHFKERLQWYGRGNLFVEDKWEGLAPFKYSIAIENSAYEHYWTEKFADCILAYTIPIYWGCTNIADYFPQGAYIQIDIDDFEGSIEVIEQTMASDFYERNFEALKEARRLILEEYQFFPSLLRQLAPVDFKAKARKLTLYPEEYFLNKKRYFGYVRRAIKKLAFLK